MLTIHINKNASGLVRYFTNSLSKDDYFFSGKSIPGRFHGRLVQELGLPEKVSQKTFSALAHNKHPVTGKKLTARNAKERRTSIEYTFSAPKSVSLIMALSEKEKGREILNAHRRAVKKVLDFIEADMQTQTRINGRKTYVTTGNIVYARFDHFTSRPTIEDSDAAKYSSDPQLHSHAVVFNCTKFNGKLQAIEGSTIHRVASYYEAIYHSYLSKSLQDLGYHIKRTKERWEIDTPGLTRRTLEKFSRRTMEIQAAARRLKITDAKRLGKLGATTRLAKSNLKENVNLKQIWLARLTLAERRGIQNAKRDRPVKADGYTPQKAIDMALSHCLERNSTVAVKKLLAQALTLGYGRLTIKEVRRELKTRDNILYAKKGYLRYLTTKEMVRAEDKMIAFAARGKSTCAPLHPGYKIQRAFLNAKQKNAIQQILKSPDRVSILSGAAGVGKSTLLVEIKEAAAQKGKHIVALAPSSNASRGVLREKRFTDADTIAMFLKNRDLQARAKNNIILVDEASMVGVKTMNEIFSAARRWNARVILSGDVRQHTSPSSGDALKLLQEKAGLKPAHVDEILRQRHTPVYKKAIELLAKGKARLGFSKLDKMNAVIEIEDGDARHQAIAKAYVQALENKESALIVSPTHAEGRMITKAVRAQMKKRGRIKNDERSFIIQRPLRLTAAQKQDHANYEDGMRVQFHQNVKGGFRAGHKYEVVGRKKDGKILIASPENGKILTLPKTAHERFQVFQKDEIKIASGDIVRITNNGRTVEKSRLHNGQIYSVKGFTPNGHIRLSNGKTLDKAYANISHGIVQTTYAAQGKDAKNVFVAMSRHSFAAINEKSFYVAASRGAKTIQIFTDDKKALLEAISKSGERMSARDIADRQKRLEPRRLMRKRRRYYEYIIKNKDRYEREKQRPDIKIQAPTRDKGYTK